MGLGAWERVEGGSVLQAQGLEALLLQQASNVVPLPHEIGWAIDRGYEIIGNRLVVGVEIDEVLPPLDGRVDDRPADGVQCALGERRERANLLDVVSEELDTNGLSPRAREHVDESSADGNLSALVDAFGTLVSGKCEGLYERVETDVALCANLDRFRSRILGRKAFRESSRRRADETSSGEDVERSCSFADEVCRGFEPRTELDTAARKQRDFRRIGIPGDGLCGIARLLVLGKKAEKGSLEGLVQRCQHERKCGLRHPGRRWKVVCERTKTLAFGERGHEPVERRRPAGPYVWRESSPAPPS